MLSHVTLQCSLPNVLPESPHQKSNKACSTFKTKPLYSSASLRHTVQTSGTISQRRERTISRQCRGKGRGNGEVPDLPGETFRAEEVSGSVRVKSVPCRSACDVVDLSVAVLASIVGPDSAEGFCSDVESQQIHSRPRICSATVSYIADDDGIQRVLWYG